MAEPEKTKWYQNKSFAVIAALSFASSTILFYQNFRIEHRLDVRDAYFNKGLIEGAKDREKAYIEVKSAYERVLEHCKQSPCKLPNELAVLPAERKFESIDSLLIKEK
jgi:hypothetical protein